MQFVELAGFLRAAFNHDGAKAILQPEFGVLVNNEEELLRALDELLADPERRARMSQAAFKYALENPFSLAAAKVSDLLMN